MMKESENDKFVYTILGIICGFVFGYKLLSTRNQDNKAKTS